MKILPKLTAQGSQTPVSSPILAVLTRNDVLAASLEALSSQEGLSFQCFKSGAKLLKKCAGEDILGVVWDAAIEEPDWSGLALVCASATIVVLGDPRPSPSCSQSVLNLSSAATAQCVVASVRSLVSGRATALRLSEAENLLAATEKRLAESVQHTHALKEHVEFYELQRNQLSEVVRRTAYLGQLSKEINSLDLDNIVNICVTKVPKIVDAALASVYLHNDETGELTLKQCSHPYRITERIVPGSTPPSLMTLAVERKATLLIRDVDAFSVTLKRPVDRTYAKKYATRSCIVVPLMSDNHVIAVLNLGDKTTGAPFDEVRDLPLVDHISQFIGIAMRNCQLYQEVWTLAKTDALTGFMNHNAFFDELHREMSRAQRTGASLSLVLMDVDNFKLFNDIHGHQVGDMILSQVAQIIRSNVRSIDVAARYGGDEFAIILTDADTARAQLVAERIRRATAANQLLLDGRNFFVTVSAGVAQHVKGQSISDIVSAADEALYASKSRGRNTVSTHAV